MIYQTLFWVFQKLIYRMYVKIFLKYNDSVAKLRQLLALFASLTSLVSLAFVSKTSKANKGSYLKRASFLRRAKRKVKVGWASLYFFLVFPPFSIPTVLLPTVVLRWKSTGWCQVTIEKGKDLFGFP